MRPRALTHFEEPQQQQQPSYESSHCRYGNERALSHRRNSPTAFNVMVVGRKSVGKTTFLQTLCDTFYHTRLNSFDDKQTGISFNDERLSDKGKGLKIDPFCWFNTLAATRDFRNCQITTSDISKSNLLDIEFVDTPGIDSRNMKEARQTINKIQGEIERRLLDTVDNEIQARRSKASWDKHIHVIIYMLAPPVQDTVVRDVNSLRPVSAMDLVSEIDIQAIKQLGQFANIIPTFGMCDTIDKDTKNVIRKSSFFRRLRERVHPTKLFDFTDNRTLPADEARDVASFREHIIQRTPMMVCGSSHVAAWQKKRHSKMNKTGSREDRFNWRSVDTPLNSARFAESTIAENIIGPCASDVSDVSGSDDGSSSNNNGRCASNGLASLAAQVTPNDSQESLKSQYTLPTNTDVIQVQRYMQQRDISLVREFDWGNLQLTNPNHCNFALLHDILFRSYREALQAMTNKYFYEDYRKKRLASVPSVTKKSKNQYRYFKQERDSKNVAPLMDPLGYWPGAHGGDQVLNTGDTSAYSNAATDGTGSSHANDDSPAVQTRAQPQFSFSFQLPQGNEFSPFSTLGKTSSPTANFSFSRGMDQRVSDAATLTSHMARLSLGKDVSDTASDRRSSSASSSLRRHRRSTIGASTHQVAF